MKMNRKVLKKIFKTEKGYEKCLIALENIRKRKILIEKLLTVCLEQQYRYSILCRKLSRSGELLNIYTGK